MINKKKHVADALRDLRIENGWSQQELAERLGVTLQTIWRWENRTIDPSPLARKALRQIGIEI